MSNKGHLFTGDAFLGPHQIMYMEDPFAFSMSLQKLEKLAKDTNCKIYPGHTTFKQDLQAKKVLYEASLRLQKAMKVYSTTSTTAIVEKTARGFYSTIAVVSTKTVVCCRPKLKLGHLAQFVVPIT